jgi:hypothetical protein
MTKARKHLPVVQADERYEANYAARKAIADAARAELDAAIAACGGGAERYGTHRIHDKLGLEPARVIYCCRRDDGPWEPPAPDLLDTRIRQRVAILITPSGVKYEGHAVTIEKASPYHPYPVTHFLFRYDVSTVGLSDDYRPRTPEQLKAAAEQRRAKAVAKEQAELDEEARRRAADPQLGLNLEVER